MDESKLMSVIESLLFISGEPVSVPGLSLALNAGLESVDLAIDRLRERYKDAQSGLDILLLEDSVQLCTKEENSGFINEFFVPPKRANLSKSAIETLSIIAYRQPVTKAEIDELRKLNSDYVLRYLIKRKLIYVCGNKNSLGKPRLYSTTKDFLKLVGISSLKELPPIETETFGEDLSFRQ